MAGTKEGCAGFWQGWNSDDSGIKNQLDENWNRVGALIQIVVKSRALTAAPASPADGDGYIPASGSTGIWAGLANKYVVYRAPTSAWEIYTPKDGWQAVILNEGTWGTLSTFKSGAWSPGVALS